MRAYYVHLWFYRIAESSIFAFGVVYLIHVTESVSWAIAWGLVHGAVLTVMRLAGRSVLLPLLQQFGMRGTAAIGLSAEAVSALLLMRVDRGGLLLIAAATLSAMGLATYAAVLNSGL